VQYLESVAWSLEPVLIVLDHLRRVLPTIVSLALFAAALAVLRAELRAVSWSDLTRDIVSTPPHQLALAVLLIVLNFIALSGNEFLAFAYLGKKLPGRVVALTSFLAYAIANSFGLAAVSGAAVRYRFYSRAGVTVEELSRIVFSYGVSFWLGPLTLGGLSLALVALPAVNGLPAPAVIRTCGWLLMACPVVYLTAALVRAQPIRIRQLQLPMPSFRLACAQLVVSCVEWALAAGTLYVLLPAGAPSFVAFVGAFLSAILLGLASQVPGGVGVFEGLMVLLLAPSLSARQILPALVVFRAAYYLAPLMLAVPLLVADELHQRRPQVLRAGAVLDRLAQQLTPRALAALTFLAGLVLLFSGATPAVPGRLAWIAAWVPLGVVETSHFLGSVAGAVLLVLAQGLSRRLDAAYYASVLTIVGGIVASLLKGLDYEEALLLMTVLVMLWRARPAFDRRAAFFDTQFSPEWVSAVVAAVGASIWLGLFAFQHVAYSNRLWWDFALTGDASRYLRASVGSALVLLVFGIARLLAPAPHEASPVDETELGAAACAIARQPSTFPYLVYLRDKSLLFNEDRSGFIMYGVQGRTWVALGDPVAPPEAIGGLVRRFLERCDDFGGVPVFYEVRADHLHAYADFGLTFVKLGEAATVDLRTFSLEGSAGAKFRQAIRKLERDGGTFRVIDASAVPKIMRELRRVSEDWLKAKAVAEKGFSLGSFDEAYLSRFPVAVIECAGRIVAFASMWPGPDGQELSVDLMRHHREAPKGVMDALFGHLLLWGKQRGYQRFPLGMAPLSGFERSPVAPLWTRLGGFVYKHGTAVYNFQGVRAYKEKFNPIWTPRYLAYPGGFALPRVSADVAALIAGGYRRIFLKQGGVRETTPLHSGAVSSDDRRRDGATGDDESSDLGTARVY
jgi:phosphatidylglycerol lysyltransferase